MKRGSDWRWRGDMVMTCVREEREVEGGKGMVAC